MPFSSSSRRSTLLVCLQALLLLAGGGLSNAHPIPDIPVRSYFQEDGRLTVTVEVDPRCFAEDPEAEPYLLNWVLAAQKDATKDELKQQARDLIAKVLALRSEPAGIVEPGFVYAFTGPGGSPLITDEDIVMITGTWAGVFPAEVRAWAIASAREAKLAVVVRNHVNGRQHGKPAVLFPGESSKPFDPRAPEPPLQHVVFGSCLNAVEHPMLDRTLMQPMDLFLFMGDNVYADTQDMAVMRQKYRALYDSAFFQLLRGQAPVLATWDDHDYGINDGGMENPVKREAQREFLTWLNEPAASPLWQQEGVYQAHVFGPAGKRVQVILLDTRYFRSPTDRAAAGRAAEGGPHLPTQDLSKTLLGREQWQWLEGELRKPAEIRLLVSSIQFAAAAAGQECWANFPHEQKRLLNLIAETRANGLVVLSGDRHWCELSRIEGAAGYPIYDFTASSMTQIHKRGTPTINANRISETTFHQPNVGALEIDWAAADPELRLRILDEAGAARLEKVIKLSELRAR